MSFVYETAPPTLTFTLLREKHLSTVYKNLMNGKYVLYALGANDPIPASNINHDDGSPVISFRLDSDTEQIHSSVPGGITEGVLLVTTTTGEAAIVDIMWVTGENDPTSAYKAFYELSAAMKKSYIHPRLLENSLYKRVK